MSSLLGLGSLFGIGQSGGNDKAQISEEQQMAQDKLDKWRANQVTSNSSLDSINAFLSNNMVYIGLGVGLLVLILLLKKPRK